MAALVTNAAFLLAVTLAVSGQAVARNSESSDRTRTIRAALKRIQEEEWLPRVSDPAWQALKRDLDTEIARRPNGSLAMLARRAAVRIEFAATSPVSGSVHDQSFNFDTRPWFELAAPLPYFVRVHASLDGGPWFTMAAAFDRSGGGISAVALGWPLGLGSGFHHMQLLADVTFLKATAVRPDEAIDRCTFVVGPGYRQQEWPKVRRANVIGRERRTLPPISFAFFDPPAPNPFLQAAIATSAAAIDPNLPNVTLGRWLEDLLAALPDRKPRPISWLFGYCSREEALWYPGDSTGQSFWPASTKARRTRRSICATTLNELHNGMLTLRVSVGMVREDIGGWRLGPVAFHEAFIEDNIDGLDIAALSELPAALRLPRKEWPTTDLSVTPLDIVLSPSVPRPGDVVNIKVGIHNFGSRDVRWAHGYLVIQPCCDLPTITRDFFDSVAVGETLTIERSAAFPTGTGWVSVFAWAWPPGGAGSGFRSWIEDQNPDDNFTGLEIGKPLSPR